MSTVIFDPGTSCMVNDLLTPTTPAIATPRVAKKKRLNVSAPQEVSPFSVISLFSGCGGMDLGFIGGFDFLGKAYGKSLFDIIWANEINATACATYQRNIGKHIVKGDIWDCISSLPEYADVVIGGFPCQDISVNGKGAGIKGKRSGLYRAMVDVVDKIRPKIFIAENVKGLLMRHNAESLHRVLSDFRKLKYDVTYHLYLAADYGVPTRRIV